MFKISHLRWLIVMSVFVSQARSLQRAPDVLLACSKMVRGFCYAGECGCILVAPSVQPTAAGHGVYSWALRLRGGSTRNHVIEHTDATELEKTVKDTSAEQGAIDLAKEALQSDGNVSSSNPECFNQTALHCAAQFQAGPPEMMEVLVNKFVERADNQLMGMPSCAPYGIEKRIEEYYANTQLLRSDWLSAEGAMGGEALFTFSERDLYTFVWMLSRMCIRDRKDFDSPDVSEDEKEAGLLAENKVPPIH